MDLKPELLDQLLKDYKNPEDLLGEGGILKLTLAVEVFCVWGSLGMEAEALNQLKLNNWLELFLCG
jgi:putative transposase